MQELIRNTKAATDEKMEMIFLKYCITASFPLLRDAMSSPDVLRKQPVRAQGSLPLVEKGEQPDRAATS